MRILINTILRKIFTAIAKHQMKRYGSGLRVNKFCKFTKKTIVGDYCNFNGIEIYGNGDVTIGNYFHSGKESMIITSFHNYDTGSTIPYDNTNIDKEVLIEDCVWIGARVTILGGATLGEGSIIQAGSVVVGDIPKYSIAGGAPAKVFKMRDIDHYEKLKREGNFF